MKSLHLAIEATATAARTVATPRHVEKIQQHLLQSVKPFSLSQGHQFNELGKGPGLYYFEIQFPFKTEPEFNEFLRRWGAKGVKDLQKATSRVYRSRAAKQLLKVQSGEFVPLYVGKNKNVRSRVQQHLDGKAESGTFGLKLLSRADLFSGCNLRVSGITFDIGADAYFCVAFLESAIRERLHPIIGKQ